MARLRVLCDNDYSGDPDGLFQLVHHALSPSVELVWVIGSHLRQGDPFDSSATTADNAAALASEYLAAAGRAEVPVVAGSNVGLVDRRIPIDSAGARAIIAAAHADDDRPLYVCLGAGLTELASAWLLDPTIAGRFVAVWIGGAEYPKTEPPPGAAGVEYNLAIDPIAAQVVFNDSDLELWQVPRDAYRQTVESLAVLRSRLTGPLGRRLVGELDRVGRLASAVGVDTGETYILGDSPLVLLTALQSSFEPWPSSSASSVRPAPLIGEDGSVAGTLPGRSIRVWDRLDVALMLRDLYAKLADK